MLLISNFHCCDLEWACHGRTSTEFSEHRDGTAHRGMLSPQGDAVPRGAQHSTVSMLTHLSPAHWHCRREESRPGYLTHSNL